MPVFPVPGDGAFAANSARAFSDRIPAHTRKPIMRSHLITIVFITFTLHGAACSGGPSTNPDGADTEIDADALQDTVEEDPGFEVASPAPPEIPWLEDGRPPIAPPVFTPCPEGWVEVPPEDEDGVTTCNPWPEGERQECGVDETHFAGESGCTRIGSPCPSGDWADDLTAEGTVIYVRAGDPPAEGLGTRDAPFGTIAQANAVASTGDVVALSKGIYDEIVWVPGGVTLWGACVAETLIASSEPSETEATVNAGGVGGSVRNLSIGGDRMGVFVGSSDSSLRLEDVVIASTTVRGGYVSAGGSLEAENLVVRDTQEQPSDLSRGIGFVAIEGAQVRLAHAVFERNKYAGIAIADVDTMLTLEDVVVWDIQCRESDGGGGDGLVVQDGAHADASRLVLERNRNSAIFASGAGTLLNLADVVVRDTGGRDDGSFGRGIQSQRGARVTIVRGLFERNREASVTVVSADTWLSLTDTVVRDTLGQARNDTFGFGIVASTGAHVEANRVILARNQYAAVSIVDPRTEVILADALVLDTQSQESNYKYGAGLMIGNEASASLERVAFERNTAIGVAADNSGTTLMLTDVVVRDTQAQDSDLAMGSGIGVHDGAAVSVERALIEHNRYLGAYAGGAGTSLTLTDVIVCDTASRASDGKYGRGLDVEDGAQVEATRAIFQRNRGSGVAAFLEGTLVRMLSVTITETQEYECASGPCAGYGAGTGIGSYAGAQVEVDGFAISQSALCGIQLAHGADEHGVRHAVGGTIDLHNGVVSNNPIGVNIQTEDFDINRLMDGVLYIDNEIKLDTMDRPVPDAVYDSGIP